MLTNRTFKIFLLSLIFMILSMASSCVEEPLFLNSTQLKLVDTLVKHQVIPLRVEIDSLCDLRFDKEVEKAKDSIMLVRIRAINKRLGR
jgi:hypothetical protein